MSATRQARLKYNKLKHFVEIKELGYIYSSMGKINGLERRVHTYAEALCNEDIPESTQIRKERAFIQEAASLFGGELPRGFELNFDPRGYALKINDDVMREYYNKHKQEMISYRDWGGYGILAPEFAL